MSFSILQSSSFLLSFSLFVSRPPAASINIIITTTNANGCPPARNAPAAAARASAALRQPPATTPAHRAARPALPALNIPAIGPLQLPHRPPPPSAPKRSGLAHPRPGRRARPVGPPGAVRHGQTTRGPRPCRAAMPAAAAYAPSEACVCVLPEFFEKTKKIKSGQEPGLLERGPGPQAARRDLAAS